MDTISGGYCPAEKYGAWEISFYGFCSGKKTLAAA
jgi:hypothetical protein